jgi:dGTPase
MLYRTGRGQESEARHDGGMRCSHKRYDRLKQDFSSRNFSSPVYQHHINNGIFDECYRGDKDSRKITASADDIVVDFIASMTDDYFVGIFKFLFADDELNERIKYIEYFDARYMGG